MNSDDYKEAIFYAASIFNERLGAEFSEDNLVLRCFQTETSRKSLSSSASSISLTVLKTDIQRTAILTFTPLHSSAQETARTESFCAQT